MKMKLLRIQTIIIQLGLPDEENLNYLRKIKL